MVGPTAAGGSGRCARHAPCAPIRRRSGHARKRRMSPAGTGAWLGGGGSAAVAPTAVGELRRLRRAGGADVPAPGVKVDEHRVERLEREAQRAPCPALDRAREVDHAVGAHHPVHRATVAHGSGGRHMGAVTVPSCERLGPSRRTVTQDRHAGPSREGRHGRPAGSGRRPVERVNGPCAVRVEPAPEAQSAPTTGRDGGLPPGGAGRTLRGACGWCRAGVATVRDAA